MELRLASQGLALFRVATALADDEPLGLCGDRLAEGAEGKAGEEKQSTNESRLVETDCGEEAEPAIITAQNAFIAAQTTAALLASFDLMVAAVSDAAFVVIGTTGVELKKRCILFAKGKQRELEGTAEWTKECAKKFGLLLKAIRAIRIEDGAWGAWIGCGGRTRGGVQAL
jgi:hypothetical protein